MSTILLFLYAGFLITSYLIANKEELHRSGRWYVRGPFLRSIVTGLVANSVILICFLLFSGTFWLVVFSFVSIFVIMLGSGFLEWKRSCRIYDEHTSHNQQRFRYVLISSISVFIVPLISFLLWNIRLVQEFEIMVNISPSFDLNSFIEFVLETSNTFPIIQEAILIIFRELCVVPLSVILMTVVIFFLQYIGLSPYRNQ